VHASHGFDRGDACLTGSFNELNDVTFIPSAIPEPAVVRDFTLYSPPLSIRSYLEAYFQNSTRRPVGAKAVDLNQGTTQPFSHSVAVVPNATESKAEHSGTSIDAERV
jgi:hypothetical protein